MKDLEHRSQVNFVNWCRLNNILIFAIPNGGARNLITAKKLKAEGVLAGMPDLCLPEYNLYIEMKAPKGKLSLIQKLRIKELKKAGCNVAVCYSTEEAIKEFRFFENNKDWQKQRNLPENE